MANEFKIKKGLIVTGASGGTVVDIQGSQGQLFSVTDDLSGSIFAVSDISGVPIFDVNSSGLSTFDGNVNLPDNKKILLGTGNDIELYHDGTHSHIINNTGDLTIDSQGDDLLLKAADDFNVFVQGSDIAIQAFGDGKVGLRYNNVEKFETTNTGVTVTGTAKNNGIEIESAVPSILFDETDVTANWRNRVQSGGYRIQYASDGTTFTDYMSLGANAFTLAKDTTFTEQAFSTATSSGDASSTLTTKGYVDGLITGATIYRGTWQAGISATSTGTTSSSTTLTVSAAILDAAGNTPVLVGAVVTGAGITGTVKVSSVTSSTVYELDTAISATATAYIFSPIYGAPDLSGVTQTSGYYYICSEAGSATPNGAGTEPNTWGVGDWVIWNDDVGSGEWQKVDNSSVLSGAGTGQTVALWEGPSSVTDSETLGNAPITVSGNNATFGGNIIAGGAVYPATNASASLGLSNKQWAGLDLSSSSAITWGNGDAEIIEGETNNYSLTFKTYDGTSNSAALRLDGDNTATFAGTVTAADLLTVNGDGHLFLGADGETPKIDMMYDDHASGLGWDTRIFTGKTDDLPNGQSFPTYTIAGGYGTQYQANSDGAFFGIIPYAAGHFRPVINWGDDVTDTPFSFQFNGTNIVNISYAGTVSAPIFDGDHKGTINTATTGVTQTAGNNSTLIATTAYADAAAGAIPIGDYLPLAGGTMDASANINMNSGSLSSVDYIDFGIGQLNGVSTSNLILKSLGNITYNVDSNNNGNSSHIFQESGSELMRIRYDGNVGIGNTNPNVRLVVADGPKASSGTLSNNSTLDIYGVAATSRTDSATVDMLRLHRAVTADNKGSTFAIGLSYYADPGSNLPRTRVDFKTTSKTVDDSDATNTVMSLVDSGNVGIGTDAPLQRLSLFAGINESLYDVLGVYNSVTGTTAQNKGAAIRIGIGVDGSYSTKIATIYEGNNPSFLQPALAFYTMHNTYLKDSETEKMRISSNGNVGIGFTSPGSTPLSSMKLSVNGNGYFAGNVGIGTTSPGAKLHTKVGTSGGAPYDNSVGIFAEGATRSIIQMSSTSDAYLMFGDASVDNQAWFGYNHAADQLLLHTGGTITMDGNVGIGTTSPGAKLDIAAVTNAVVRLTSTGNGLGADTALGSLQFYGNDASVPGAGIKSSIVAKTEAALGDDSNLIFSTSDGTTNNVERMRIDSAGNVGIGTSTPLAKLDIQGTQGQLFSVTDDLSGSIFAVSDISGVPIFDVNSSGVSYFDGDVGIGTTSPSSRLEVYGTDGLRTHFNEGLRVTRETVPTQYGMVNYNGGALNIIAVNTAGTGSVTKFMRSGNGTSLDTSMVIDTSGNVGIGTTSPGTLHGAAYGTTRLHVDGGTDRGQMIIEGDSFAGIVLSDNGATANQRVFATSVDDTKYTIKPLNDNGTSTAGGVAVTVLHNGNVGIGATSPTNKLHIQGSQATVYSSTDSGGQASAGTTINNTNTAGSTNNFSQLLFTVGTNNNSVSRIVAIRSGSDASDLAFVGKSAAGVAEYMRIKSGGNVGIGINNPSALLEVRKGSISGQIAKFSAINPHVVIESSTAGNAVLHLKPNTTGSKSGQFKVTAGNGYNFRWSNDASGTAETAYMDLDTSTTGGGDLTVKGDVIAYGSPSDKKYKENIKPIESALDKAMQLQGVTFDWKDSESILEIKEDIGFIAQDVQEVLPELVRDNGKGNLSLRYQGITPILLEAIKELKAEIEELKLNNCNCNK